MSTQGSIAFELAEDYISYKLGKTAKPISIQAALLRKLANEIEAEHEFTFAKLYEKLEVGEATAAATFKQVADGIFADGINWGRIVVLYTFGGQLASFGNQRQLNFSEEVIQWVGEYVSGMSEWIKETGGWNNFLEQFGHVN